MAPVLSRSTSLVKVPFEVLPVEVKTPTEFSVVTVMVDVADPEEEAQAALIFVVVALIVDTGDTLDVSDPTAFAVVAAMVEVAPLDAESKEIAPLAPSEA